MAWENIPDSWLDAEEEILDDADNLFDAMDLNITAWYQGLSGAPKLTGDAWADNSFNADRFAALSFTGGLFEDESVTQSRMGAASVGQAELKTFYGEIKTSYNAVGMMTLNPAGAQMLGYESKSVTTGPSGSEYYRFGFPGLDAIQDATAQVIPNLTNNIATESWIFTFASTPIAEFLLRINFVSASPPYEVDGREAKLFVYLRQRPDGSIASVWTSPVPPWAYNGPHSVRPNLRHDGKGYQLEAKGLTGDLRADLALKRAVRNELDGIRAKHRAVLTDIRRMESEGKPLPFRAQDFKRALALDFRAHLERLYDLHELTPARKNLDLALYPQPFGPNPRAASIDGDRVVLLDPSDRMADDLLVLHTAGESVGEALGSDYLRVGDDLAGAPTPAGIPAVGLQWRASA